MSATRGSVIDPTEPLAELDAETLARSIADQLAEHPHGDDAAERLDRLATLTAARSAADAHLARIIRRALALHHGKPCHTPTGDLTP